LGFVMSALHSEVNLGNMGERLAPSGVAGQKRKLEDAGFGDVNLAGAGEIPVCESLKRRGGL